MGVEGLRRVGEWCPEFAHMYKAQDPDLFLVVPRLVWLLFLANPQTIAPLLETLLPHRLEKECKDGQLAKFIADLRNVTALLDPCTRNSEHELSAEATNVLLKFAVGGEI